MININGSDIKITKGDTAYIQIDLLDEAGEPLTVTDADTVRIQVRDRQTGGELLFVGSATLDTEDSCVQWHIRPEDTAEASPKSDYFWDGEIETETGDIYTFVNVSRFKVLPEITRKDGGDA